MYSFTGQDVGPFFIHQAFPDGWKYSPRGNVTITHAATGFSVHTGIRTKAGAVRAAQQLAKLGCWDFTEAAHTKLIPSCTKQAIRTIVESA